MAFAKLYETQIGQILVKLDSSDSDGMYAEVRIYFEPEGFGICSSAFGFKEWDDAEKAFDMIDINKALDVANNVIGVMGK